MTSVIFFHQIKQCIMKKSITPAIIFAIIFFFPLIAFSQFNTAFLKAIAKEKFDDTEKKVLKSLQKKPNDVELNFTMAVLYISPKYQNYNEEKAYEYLVKAQKAFESTSDEKLIKKLDKIPINALLFENYTDTICNRAFTKATDINNVEAYENFLTVYKTAPEKYSRKITELRNEKKFEEVIQGNSVEAYQNFISRFPDAAQIPEAITKRNALAFEKTRRLDKIQDYREFISKFPDAKEVETAYDRIHELAYQQAERENTAASYKYFIDEYPSSKQYKKAFNMMEKRQFLENTTPGDWKKYRDFIKRFPENSWKAFALDSIYMIGTKTDNIEIIGYCIDNYTGEKRNKAMHVLYDIFTSDGEKSTLDMFYSVYDDDSFTDFKVADYKWASIGDSLLKTVPKEMNKPLFEKFIKETAPNEKAYRVLRRLIEQDIDTKNWAKALETVNNYAPYFKDKNKKLSELQYFLEMLKNAPKPQANVQSIPVNETQKEKVDEPEKEENKNEEIKAEKTNETPVEKTPE